MIHVMRATAVGSPSVEIAVLYTDNAYC